MGRSVEVKRLNIFATQFYMDPLRSSGISGLEPEVLFYIPVGYRFYGLLYDVFTTELSLLPT